MKSLVSKLMMVAVLATPVCGVAGCNSDDGGTDATGKTISDLDIGSDRTLDKGQTEQATATVEYADGTNANVTRQVVWNTSNAGVATISANGVVTAVSTGTASLKASYNGTSSADRTVIVR